MKLIPLTQGKFAQVDDEDYEWLMQWKWCYVGKYALRITGRPNRKTVMMHREIMQTPDGMDTDHVNANGETDGLNNQRYNLRICTQSQNRRNASRRSDNTSGYKGVTWRKSNRKWRAKIQGEGGKCLQLGHFDDPVEAAQAYDKAARELFGEFARLNFPSQTEAR